MDCTNITKDTKGTKIPNHLPRTSRATSVDESFVFFVTFVRKAREA